LDSLQGPSTLFGHDIAGDLEMEQASSGYFQNRPRLGTWVAAHTGFTVQYSQPDAVLSQNLETGILIRTSHSETPDITLYFDLRIKFLLSSFID
jgi:hypothetical protein